MPTEEPKKQKVVNFLRGLIGLAVIIFVIVLLWPNSSGTNDSTPTPTMPDTPEGKIEALVRENLSGDNNMDKPYVRDIIVSPQEDGSWTVEVKFNADDNFGASLQKAGIETKMSEIYTDLFTSEYDIKEASIVAFFPTRDTYGNENDSAVYRTTLTKEEAKKVNWDTEEATLQLTILPGIWTTTIQHPDFR